MERWKRLVTVALAGTEQGALPELDDGSALAATLALPADTEPERALLLAAGATALYRRAGWEPAPLPVTPLAPCPPDTLPPCSSAAGSLLARLLEGRRLELLPEWLTLAARVRVRVADEVLPDLLDLARRQPDLTAALLPVLGERGRWLARHNPAWVHVLFDEGNEAWQRGAPPVRAAYLRWLRGHDPEQARALLEAAWAKDTRTARAPLVAALEAGLSMADEPFLEAALDHAQEDVRRAAVALLVRLAESRLVHRMEERARQLITWSDDTLTGAALSHRLKRIMFGGSASSAPGRLIAVLPGECDPAMVRDGLPPRHLPSPGERAAWLHEIVAAVPPQRWIEWTGRTHRELLKAAGSDEHGLLSSLPAWRAATERYGDIAWARTFFDAWQVVHTGRLPAVIDPDKRLPFPANSDGPPAPAPGPWLDLLPPAEVEWFVIALLASTNVIDETVLTFLGPWRSVWTEATGRAVLARLGRALDSRHPGEGDGAAWRERLPEIALHLPPSLAPELRQLLPANPAYGGAWDSYLNRFIATLALRHEIHQEFAQ